MAAVNGQTIQLNTVYQSSLITSLSEACECEETTLTSTDTFTTAIPAFASQIHASGSETVQVSGGTLQTLATTNWYYLVSSLASASNGESLLYALKLLLQASLAGTTWTVTIQQAASGRYKINLSHNNVSSRTITFSAGFATALGFASASFAVAASTTVVADYPSYWWWTPDMMVSNTGPVEFDPETGYGTPESAGAVQRSSDMTIATVQNGIQVSAIYEFTGVQYYYKMRKTTDFPNDDFETWWLNGPALGKKLLWWRDRNDATGSNAPSAGSASPYNYIVYGPDVNTMTKFPAKLTVPHNLTYWNLTMSLLVTELGESPVT